MSSGVKIGLQVRVKLARVLTTLERRSLTCNRLQNPTVEGQGNLAESRLEALPLVVKIASRVVSVMLLTRPQKSVLLRVVCVPLYKWRFGRHRQTKKYDVSKFTYGLTTSLGQAGTYFTKIANKNAYSQ